MVEQDAVGGMHVISLAVVHAHPIGVKLGRRIGAAGLKGGGFALRLLHRITIKFGSRGLIKAGGFFQTQDAHGFQQSKRPQSIRVGRVFGRLEAHLDMALGGKIIDFRGLHLLHQADQIGGIGHIAEMKDEFHILFVGVLVKVIDPARIERRGAALHAVHLIALGQQEFGQIGTVLPGDARYQCFIVGLASVPQNGLQGVTQPGETPFAVLTPVVIVAARVVHPFVAGEILFRRIDPPFQFSPFLFRARCISHSLHCSPWPLEVKMDLKTASRF